MKRLRRTLLVRYAVAFALIVIAIAVILVFTLGGGAGRALEVMIGLAILLAALGALTVWTERTLAADLKELGRAMERVVVEGELQTMPQPRLAELTDLARDLESIAIKVREDYRLLTRERDHLQAVLTNINVGIIVVGRDLGIDHVNPMAEKLLGTSRDLAVGRKFAEVHHTPAIDQAIEESRRGRVVSEEVTISLPRRRILGVHASPIRDESGQVRGVVCILEDVTARRRLELNRRDFVANVSHELRTPVANVLATLDALLSGAMGDARASERFLGDLQREARRLADIIEDLLVLSRLETEGVVNLDEQFEVGPVLSEVVEDKRLSAERRDVSVALSGGYGDAMLKGDRKLFKTAFSNLVENAIKYNVAGGSVEVVVEQDGDMIRVKVADTGIGIPAGDLDRIFERFYRVDKARARETGGTGLGLSIVKHVTEFHGGSVEVASSEGAGSTFIMNLPRYGSLF